MKLAKIVESTRISVGLCFRGINRLRTAFIFFNDSNQCWTWSGFRIAIQPNSAIQNWIRIGLDFEKNSTGLDTVIQTELITAVWHLIRRFFGYKLVWIKFLDCSIGLGSDMIIQCKFLTGLGLQKSSICSILPQRYCNMFFYYCVVIMIYHYWRRNKHLAFSLCIKGNGTMYLHMWYSTLTYCICDIITDWSIARYQEIF